MIVKLNDAIRIANLQQSQNVHRKHVKGPVPKNLVGPNDIAVMLQYALLGLNATQIEDKMNQKFSRETIRRHIHDFKTTRRTINESKAYNYLKDFDTSYAAGIEV